MNAWDWISAEPAPIIVTDDMTHALDLHEYKTDNQILLRRSDSPNDLDLKVFEFFKSKGIDKGYYIECGANNGIFQSNTFLLEQIGWTGMLIEADPKLTQSCRHFRKNNIIHNAALVNSSYASPTIEGMFSKFYSITAEELEQRADTMTDEKRKEFFSKIYHSILTGHISEEVYDDYEEISEHYEKKSVPASTLTSVLQMYNVKPWAIDFFSLDVEGMELDVLDGLGLKHYRPKYILTEVTNLSKTAPDEIHSFMANNNYKQVASFDAGHDIMFEAQ